MTCSRCGALLLGGVDRCDKCNWAPKDDGRVFINPLTEFSTYPCPRCKSERKGLVYEAKVTCLDCGAVKLIYKDWHIHEP